MQTSRSATGLVGAALLVLLPTVLANGQETTRVSVDSSGGEGNDDSFAPAISADGRFVAFVSYASDLVHGDTNMAPDVFVHDRSTGITERVSVDSSGVQGNGNSSPFDGSPSISADGQIVVFWSAASNLVAGDTNGRADVFVHDLATGVTERVSLDSSGAQANSDSTYPSISADGQIVAFVSWASNLVAGDTNGQPDVFVHDRATGVTQRVSVDSSGAEGNRDSGGALISADGQIVTFTSWASNLVAGDTNGYGDAFVHDRATGVTERVSVDSSGVEADNGSGSLSISADGQIVAISSFASNLVAGDTNGCLDVFVHDRSTGITERVSVDSSGLEGNGPSFNGGSISADGQIVAFSSQASNLVGGTTRSADVYVHDRATGITERVSVDSSGAEGNDYSATVSISADGRILAFMSNASNLVAGDTNSMEDVFVHERCDATWMNYGAGFPGTNGVPSFTSRADPVLGTTVTLDLANSYGNGTIGLVLVGYQETLVPTNKGGDLRVAPAFTFLVTLAPSGISIVGALPADDALCGFELFAQALELDPGAAKGTSFTQGLELVLGH